MEALDKARERASSAWATSREGTRRTALWVKDSIADGGDRVRDAFRRDGEQPGGKASEPETKKEGGTQTKKAGEAAAEGTGGAAQAGGLRERVASMSERARDDHRVAIAWVAGTLLLVAWIAWTIYIWSENGAAAGVGVLVSWPAVLAALALVAAAGAGAWMLLRRIVPDHEPALAGGAPAALATEPAQDEDEADEPEEEPEDDAEQEEDADGEDDAEE